MRLLIVTAFLVFLGACSPTIPLSPGLSDRMDVAGAQLNRSDSIAIINHLRTTKGVARLSLDADLNEKAQKLANQYAATGVSPKKPKGIAQIRTSAGYVNFAQTFSGWRNEKVSEKVLIDANYSRAGIGVAYVANSKSGTYWVLLLASGSTIAVAQ
ncbi:MAG: CAP domain-containing protein [Devosiaceae bacterium]|nr:CAP domain-containing protein [Devosiaceae bacterium]